MKEKITQKTPVIFYDLRDDKKQGYILERFGKWEAGMFPVCTLLHFIQTVCQLFDEVTPKIKENPMYQDLDWASELKGLGI